MEFVGELVAGTAGAGAERVSALNHEVGNHAMENQTVVERAPGLLPALRVDELFGALGKIDEVRHGVRCLGIEQPDPEAAFRRREMRMHH
jgi:hypothetical protein